MTRDFDLVLYGATGFTRRQAAACLAAHAPPGLRWAIAGRDRQRPAAVGIDAPVLAATTDDAAQLDALAARTRVTLT